MSEWMKDSAIIMTAAGFAVAGGYFVNTFDIGLVTYLNTPDPIEDPTEEPIEETVPPWPLPLDTKEYDKRMLALADYVPPKPKTVVIPATASSSATTTTIVPPSPLRYSSSTNVTVEGSRWPTKAPYPEGDAILPFKRILAYYGNFYSRQMGILGELEPQVVLEHLASTTAMWEAADPNTPVLPAIEYIASVAQGSAGEDGMYRSVMPDEEIERAYAMAEQINGILILDIQIGKSTIQNELPKFRKYLMRPNVHLAIDPEFSMKYGRPPGTVIGTYDATDINDVINYLADIVREYKLPPKVLIVHRFTQDMVTNYKDIQPQPEVQVVMNMDGWGSKDLKRGTYTRVIEPEPVQFTGVKLFYKNDLKPPSTGIFTPEEVLDLHPKPIYVQYQ